jgi:HK97 family phage major capsid protein
MTDKELVEMIEEMASNTKDITKSHAEFLAVYNKRLDEIEKIVARGGLGGGGSIAHGSFGFSGHNPEYSAAFDRWVRKGDESIKALSPRASMREAEDPAGGFIIPEDLDLTLDRVAAATVAMRKIAQVKTGLRGDYKRPFNQGGATGGWVGESDTRSETDTPELTLFEPPWSEIFALPKVSQTLLDNAGFDVAGWLVEEIGLVETEMEGAAFIIGNGVKQPTGILTYDTVANASYAWGKIGYIAGGHASLLNDADKLIDLQHALKAAYRKNAVWLMNDLTLSVIRKFKDGEGNYVWRPGLAENAPETILGKPVEIDDNMPDIGSDEYPVAFGDFKRAYLIGDHAVGRRLVRDPYSEKGQVLFYEYRRVFGGVINFEAIKLLKIAES